MSEEKIRKVVHSQYFFDKKGVKNEEEWLELRKKQSEERLKNQSAYLKQYREKVYGKNCREKYLKSRERYLKEIGTKLFVVEFLEFVKGNQLEIELETELDKIKIVREWTSS